MKGETREEIINTIIYGTRAWRFVRLRQLLGERKRSLSDGRGLRPDHLSAGLRAMKAHIVHATAHAVPNMKALDRLWNELRAKRKGKSPPRKEWLKARNELLTRLPKPPPLPDNTWIEAACVWRELSQQIESALVIGVVSTWWD